MSHVKYGAWTTTAETLNATSTIHLLYSADAMPALSVDVEAKEH